MAHVNRARINPNTGARVKNCLFINDGLFCSLINNLIASANG